MRLVKERRLEARTVVGPSGLYGTQKRDRCADVCCWVGPVEWK